MKIVIDIDEETYKCFIDDWLGSVEILRAVRKGTPLPKGHGRLGDLDALEKEMEGYSEGAFAMTPEFLVKHAPTIIESDIAESE